LVRCATIFRSPLGFAIAEEESERKLEDAMTLQPYLYANDQSRRRTILLVEDEPFVREATCNILQRAGFEVLPAANVPDALKIYEQRQRSIDLVMTDMVLPGASGQQLGQDLRRRSPEVRVLVTSGYGNPEYNGEAPESHTYFLAKPYSRKTLLEKVEQILEVTHSLPAAQVG
jgi:two-component system, cell cycle sensor histidine kinase and response regulator CckA